jgi:hypothetical protein
MTIGTKKDFEDRITEALHKDKWFDGLVVQVRAIDQLDDSSHPNNVRFEVHVLINGFVEGLPVRERCEGV